MRIILGQQTPTNILLPYKDVRGDDADLLDLAEQARADGKISYDDGEDPAVIASRLNSVRDLVAHDVDVPLPHVQVVTSDDWDDADIELRHVITLWFLPGEKPTWVECSDTGYQTYLAQKWDVPVGPPAGDDEDIS